jgi:hypothetical protein
LDIQEAIAHAEAVGNEQCGECALEHQQLAAWLRQLVELRKIVERADVKFVLPNT